MSNGTSGNPTQQGAIDTNSIQKGTAAASEFNDQAGLQITRLATLKESLESVEKAFSAFNDVVKDKGLQEATKRFYDLNDSITVIRKNANDLNAVSDNTAEKISLMSKVISDSEASLRSLGISLAETSRNIAAQTKAYDENLAAQKRLKSEREKTEKISTEMSEALRLKLYAEEKLNEIKAGRYATDQEIYALEQNFVIQSEKLNLLENEYNDSKKEQEKLEEQLQDFDATKAKAQIERLKNNKKELEDQAKKNANELTLAGYEKSRLKALDDTNRSMDGFIGKLTGGAERSNVLGSMFLSMQKSVDGTNRGVGDLFTNMADGLTKSLLDPEKATNRFFNLINDKLIKSTFEFDRALAQVGKSTGGFRKEFENVAFSGGVISDQAFRNLTEYGVGLEKYGQAYGALSKSIGGFNNMLASQRKMLTDNAASMETLGLSADSYGKIVTTMMASVGKTADGSRQVIEGLAKDAIALGKNVGEYANEFQNAFSKITGYGREATSIFKELNALSMATKGAITSQDLLSISDRFKDFDSAAESVSKLNAVMGGMSINVLDMMKANPAEQIMMIKRASSEAGLEFDKLNIGYKRLLAEYFGGDVGKAAAFFKADMAEAERLMNKAVESEEQLAERKKQNVAFTEKLTALTDSLKVAMTPVLDIATKVVGGLATLLKMPGGPIIATLGLITGSFFAMQFAIGRVTAMIGAKIAALGTAAATATAEAGAVAAASTAEVAANKAAETSIWAKVKAALAFKAAAGTPTPGGGMGAGGGAAGGGGGGFWGGGGGMLLGGALIAGGIMGISYLAKEKSEERQEKRLIERERILSQMRREEAAAAQNFTGINPALTQPTQSVEDVLFIADDSGKQIKESYKLSAGDKMLPIGKEGGPLQSIFNPKTGEALNTFNETLNASTTNVGGNINAGTTTNAATQVAGQTNINQNVQNNKNQSSNVASQQMNSPINLTAYLTLDGRNISLITKAVNEEMKSTVPS